MTSIKIKAKSNAFSAERREGHSTRKATRRQSFFQFMQDEIKRLEALDRIRTSETYAATFRSICSFRSGKDFTWDEINEEEAIRYESYLKRNGKSMNTVSFYMRIFRAVYNRAVEKGLTLQHYPFKHVYTGVGKTRKRAVPLSVIKQLKQLELPLNSSLDFARDMFLFSFYTRGMSFIDMAYLKKKDLKDGFLIYRRRKTGQQLCICWEKCMQDIIEKYPLAETGFLLPIITRQGGERRQYINAIHLVNRKLKEMPLSAPHVSQLSMYVARHSWASIALRQHIPLSVISESMGHESESTTRIYLASLDNSVIDQANARILKKL